MRCLICGAVDAACGVLDQPLDKPVLGEEADRATRPPKAPEPQEPQDPPRPDTQVDD